MNILYVFLLLCVIYPVFASVTGLNKPQVTGKVVSIGDSPEEGMFRSAIDKGDVEAAICIFNKGNDDQKECYGKYLISLGSKRLVGLIKSSEDYKYWLLSMIILYAKQDLIKEVFKEVEPSDLDLPNIARNAGLACAPGMFMNLFERITDKNRQIEGVELGVLALFAANKAECFYPLLSALQSNASLDQEVKDRAIKEAFRDASLYPTDNRASSLVKDYFDHSVVLAGSYSYALYNSYRQGGSEHHLFNWLLKEADRGDLEAVKKEQDWEYMSKEFKEVINRALKTAKPKGTRHQGRIERAILARETFSEVGNIGTQGPGDIIAAYLVGDSGVEEVQNVEAARKQVAPRTETLEPQIVPQIDPEIAQVAKALGDGNFGRT